MNPLATNATRRRVALPKRTAQDTSPRVFPFAEASGVPGRPQLLLIALVRALTDETVCSQLHNQTRSGPARATDPLTYAS